MFGKEKIEFPSGKKENNDEAKMDRRKFLKGLTASIAAMAIGLKTKDTIINDEDEKTALGLEKLKGDLRQEELATIEQDKIDYPYIDALSQLKNNHEYLPPEIINDDLIIALEIQESDLDPKAGSSKGAVGLMQITSNAIMQVSEFLYYLDKEGTLDYRGKVWSDDKGVDTTLTEDDIKKIKETSMAKPEINEAIGRLYLAWLWDQGLTKTTISEDKDGNTTKQQYNFVQEAFKKRGSADARNQLLAAYNVGPTAYRKYNGVIPFKETQDYVVRVNNYIKRIDKIRTRLLANDLDYNNNTIVKFIAKKMEFASKHSKDRANHLEEIREENIEVFKNHQEKLGRPLSENDIEKIIIQSKGKVIKAEKTKIKKNRTA